MPSIPRDLVEWNQSTITGGDGMDGTLSNSKSKMKNRVKKRLPKMGRNARQLIDPNQLS